MKKLFLLAGALLISATAGLAQLPAATPAPATKEAKPPKSSKKLKVLPTGDAAIKICMDNKLAKSKMATENFVASLASGTATFTGSTKIPGHKGGVSGIGKSCGAKAVVNNIIAEGRTAPISKPKSTKTLKTPAATPATN